MKRVLLFLKFSLLIGCPLLLNFCKKENENQPLNDLFPVQEGQEYYYSYYSLNDHILIGYCYLGNEKWTIKSDSANDKDIIHCIERKFNGIRVDWNYLSTKSFKDTTLVTDSIIFMTIEENKNSSILTFPVWGISLNRFQNIKETTIELYDSGLDPYKSWRFQADSGLCKYYYSEGLTSFRIRESLILDSIKPK